MNLPDAAEVRDKIDFLRNEHLKLDSQIHEMSLQAQHDQLELRRLKKRKLLIKDQIAALEASLVPDIPA